MERFLITHSKCAGQTVTASVRAYYFLRASASLGVVLHPSPWSRPKKRDGPETPPSCGALFLNKRDLALFVPIFFPAVTQSSTRSYVDMHPPSWHQERTAHYVLGGPMTSPCPDKSYPSHCRVLAGGQSPVEAYVGIKEPYQGIF